MNLTSETANLGLPVPLDHAAIEQELSAFWKSASDREGEGAIIRACSCNLILIVQSLAETADLPTLLSKVAEWHPCRFLTALRGTEGNGGASADSPRMQAWINAQCHVPFPGGPQVCCEAITVAAWGNAAAELPNTLVSLLVPDLPVFLYWRSFKLPDRELVERVAQFSDLLIVDSHASKDDPENRVRLLELLTNAPRGIAVRDLNWSRLTAWRDLIAQFFDAPSFRRYAWQLSDVEVCRRVALPGSLPTRTLLLVGWLATRLDWKRIAAEHEAGEWRSRWKSRSGEVVVRFTESPSEAGQASGISSITLKTRDGPAFAVTREDESACMTATTTAEGAILVHSVPQESMDEATLLVRELSLAGEEAGFQAALREALALEQSFR